MNNIQISESLAERVDHDSPFDLRDTKKYQLWRKSKLEKYEKCVADIVVPVVNINALTETEIQALTDRIRTTNMVIYTCEIQHNNAASLIKLCAQMGLKHFDNNLYSSGGVSTLMTSEEKRQYEYIPYSNKAIKWHTDGYYNSPDKTIRSMVLHCVQPAQSGGSNQYLDHEIVYIQLRDRDPRFIHALMQADVMTIPANIENGIQIRPKQSGPVFSIEPSGNLHMRYTARTRSIEWKQDSVTCEAVSCLEEILASSKQYTLNYRLNAGQGVLCNNVLHTRTQFTDGENKRQVFRIRCFERINGTGFSHASSVQ